MDIGPFAAEGRWYRGNLHTHTTESDADRSPGEMCRAYREAGYDFVCLTDHNRVCDIGGLSADDFLVLPGAELSGMAGERHCDLACINVAQLPEPHRGAPANEVIAAARELGGEVILAHPYDLSTADVLGLEGILGLEVYNHSVQMYVRRGCATQHWDALLARGGKAFGFATDDAHYHSNDLRPLDLHGGWIMVRAAELTAGDVLGALRRGHFFASTGAGIEELTVTGSSVSVRTTAPCRNITFAGPTWATSRSFMPFDGGLITEARFELGEEQRYLRVECTAPDGSMAWTQPLWLD